MGMAASQARYLALVARKSNCEYEGQQINQARLALSNQSANLFNQMLGLTVPTPPSTQDFTRTQYSFSDGNHSYIIDNWRQLPASDTQYNYYVNAHYFTDVYTGSMKTMVDPQVQMSNAGSSVASLEEIKNRRAALAAAKSAMEERYNYWQMVKTAQEAQIASIRRTANTEMASQTLSSGLNDANVSPILGGNLYDFSDNTSGYKAYIYNYTGQIPTGPDDKPVRMLDELANMVELGVLDLTTINNAIWARDPEQYGDVQFTDVDQLRFTGGQYSPEQRALINTYAFVEDEDHKYYLSLAKDVEDVYAAIHDDEQIGSLSGRYMSYLDGGDYVSLGADYLDQIEDCNDLIRFAYQSYQQSKNVYDAALAAYDALTQPTYIGNSPLTYLDELTEDQEIELQQVVRDMIAQGIDTDILNCFDTYGNYLGGVYSFQIYGVTYYTTYQNLIDAYASNTNSNNLIDDQYRMPYYNASYINTRVDQQGKALLETDGTGRFTTIRFEDTSVAYTLNMETVTDDEAYQDAMNQYYYENALYDKTVQDINAKTSIIQQEDSELELRLKQLDTEQSALKTEMDAVKKVIDDNIDASFKTFGG